VSTTGIVPACRSLDCVSIFATSAADARLVWRTAIGDDAADPYARPFETARSGAPWLAGSFRFGIPDDHDLQFFGDTDAYKLFKNAVRRLEGIGGVRVRIDYAPFRAAAELLYAGPWVAERFAAVGDFVAGDHDDVNPIVRDIVLGGRKYSAADAYRAAYRLEYLKREADHEWRGVDVLLLPTAGTIYTKAAVEADPIQLNANLGYYTNFVNLMDLAAVAVPAGFRSDGLPFGVSLIGPSFSDPALLSLASRYLDEDVDRSAAAPGCVRLAVVGAHLTGQPLNGQLTARGARLLTTCLTSAEYRLFALSNTTPAKPGLVRDPNYAGGGIEVEVWTLPEASFGSFVTGVPPPLAIGNVQLESGEWVKGFVCERAALDGALEITSLGGWRAYLSRDMRTSAAR